MLTNLEVVMSQGILTFLKEGKSRKEVMKEFHLKWTNAYDILVQLEIKGLIYRYPIEGEKKAGRPVVLWVST